MKVIIAYTDGACKGNPGPGGWGYILTYKGHKKEASGGEKNTTNNRMEMVAVIEALKAIQKKDYDVHIHTDSNMVCLGINEWMDGWKKKGWTKSNKKPVENKDLWIELDGLIQEFTGEVKCIKVLAHSGVVLNEHVDQLASEAAIAQQS